MTAAVAPPCHEHPPVLQDDGGGTVAGHVERAGERPGAGHRIEDFGRAANGRFDNVVRSSAADHEHAPVAQQHRRVAEPREVHVRDARPGARSRVEQLGGGEPSHGVDAARDQHPPVVQPHRHVR